MFIIARNTGVQTAVVNANRPSNTTVKR